jgi:RNA polymerase sigma-70 factor (ECF subfamily)
MAAKNASELTLCSALRESSDELLLAQLARGNRDALAVLFDRYQSLIFRISLQVLRNPHEAEDLLQAVFLELMRTAGQFDSSKGTARVWILQCVYNRGSNRRRYLNRCATYEWIDSNADFSDTTNAPWSDASQASLLDSARLVEQAMARLSEPQRQTIELVMFKGFTLHEIAENTGETYGGVRHHYYRGLKKMKSFISAGRKQDGAEE